MILIRWHIPLKRRNHKQKMELSCCLLETNLIAMSVRWVACMILKRRGHYGNIKAGEELAYRSYFLCFLWWPTFTNLAFSLLSSIFIVLFWCSVQTGRYFSMPVPNSYNRSMIVIAWVWVPISSSPKQTMLYKSPFKDSYGTQRSSQGQWGGLFA